MLYSIFREEEKVLNIPKDKQELAVFLSGMEQRAMEIESELSRLDNISITTDQFVATAVLCSCPDAGVGGGSTPGLSDPVYTAYLRAKEDAEKMKADIQKKKKQLEQEKWQIQYCTFVIDAHLTEPEATLIRSKYIRKGGYESFVWKYGKKLSRATYYRRLDEAMGHLLLELNKAGRT